MCVWLHFLLHKFTAPNNNSGPLCVGEKGGLLKVFIKDCHSISQQTVEHRLILKWKILANILTSQQKSTTASFSLKKKWRRIQELWLWSDWTCQCRPGLSFTLIKMISFFLVSFFFVLMMILVSFLFSFCCCF